MFYLKPVEFMSWEYVATGILKSLEQFRVVAVLTKITVTKFHGSEPSPITEGVRKAFPSYLHNSVIVLGHWWRSSTPTQDNR